MRCCRCPHFTDEETEVWGDEPRGVQGRAEHRSLTLRALARLCHPWSGSAGCFLLSADWGLWKGPPNPPSHVTCVTVRKWGPLPPVSTSWAWEGLSLGAGVCPAAGVGPADRQTVPGLTTRWHTHPRSPSQGHCLQTFVRFPALLWFYWFYAGFYKKGYWNWQDPELWLRTVLSSTSLSQARREGLPAPPTPTWAFCSAWHPQPAWCLSPPPCLVLVPFSTC